MCLQPKATVGVLDPTLATGQVGSAARCSPPVTEPDRSPSLGGLAFLCSLLQAEHRRVVHKRNDVENIEYNSYLNVKKKNYINREKPTQLGNEKRVVSSAQAQVKHNR